LIKLVDDLIEIVPYSEEFTVAHQKEILKIDLEAFEVTGIVWSLTHFTKRLPHKEQLSFYALNKKEDKIVGFLIGTSFKDDTAHLNRIATDKNFRAGGLGKRLMEHFLSSAKKLGMKQSTLNMVHSKENFYLQKFYENLGYHLLTSKEDIITFLEAKNKLNELDLFYPPFKENNELIMLKQL
jgi:ribosomal protein S18 acetylase RimI-like enzyme